MKSWERVKDVVEEAPDIIIHSVGSRNWHQAYDPSTLDTGWGYLSWKEKERKKDLGPYFPRQLVPTIWDWYQRKQRRFRCAAEDATSIRIGSRWCWRYLQWCKHFSRIPKYSFSGVLEFNFPPSILILLFTPTTCRLFFWEMEPDLSTAKFSSFWSELVSMNE